ncbi:helix-turn-helix transcriptional regulator [Priestia aryabhattai]|nr:helix-turn-helix transcriptional regulator [Priestia aryabhattai]
MNVSRQAVYKWENNKGYPDIENLIKLRDLYNITLDKLIKGDHSFQKK